MSNTTQEILDTILERMRALATTETVVGEPVTVDNITLLPVIKLSVGFAAGGGEGKGDANKDTSGSGNASAGGGGASINPVGFIAWDGESIKFVGVGKGKMDAFFETLPEMLKKVGITLPFGGDKGKGKGAKSTKKSEPAESKEEEQ
ncbi:MAG: hypothetical protein HN356_14595 [Calditrichaeota bacterium]|nr:hypothetical protein [Calditrichota bacterium]MBT7617328.1 hypothetical protein [Calditrichota bacterium]MBT7787938.1 hypothetical protein [Calditrichota bacterium]